MSKERRSTRPASAAKASLSEKPELTSSSWCALSAAQAGVVVASTGAAKSDMGDSFREATVDPMIAPRQVGNDGAGTSARTARRAAGSA